MIFLAQNSILLDEYFLSESLKLHLHEIKYSKKIQKSVFFKQKNSLKAANKNIFFPKLIKNILKIQKNQKKKTKKPLMSRVKTKSIGFFFYAV